jgi:CRISPR-associated Cas5-like protein
MQAVVVNLRLNSLYSIRLPFTWQSALTYPILPPSSVIGMLANALQRYKNKKHPFEYLKELEPEIEWAGSRLLGPCVIKSYITSAITKWEDRLGGKFTNALGRQFAFTRQIQAVAVFRDKVPEGLVEALVSVPLTCGDSESLASVEEKPVIREAIKEVLTEDRTIETPFPAPFELEGTSGNGRIYLMHERCLPQGKNFPLFSFICPMKEKNGTIEPDILKVKCQKGRSIISIDEIGKVILRE